jgi:hypothetical protein
MDMYEVAKHPVSWGWELKERHPAERRLQLRHHRRDGNARIMCLRLHQNISSPNGIGAVEAFTQMGCFCQPAPPSGVVIWSLGPIGFNPDQKTSI